MLQKKASGWEATCNDVEPMCSGPCQVFQVDQDAGVGKGACHPCL